MPLSEPSNDHLRALWESGVALDSAWIEFAKSFDRFAHRALCTDPANDPDAIARDRRYNELQRWLPKTWEARQQMLLVTTRNERGHLLGEIYAGRLWAIGFQTFLDGSAELVRVPHQHFFFKGGVGGANIHWSKGELTVGTAIYSDIHVAQAPTNLDPHAVVAPNVGRPNKRNQIRSKVEELWKDPLFRAIPNRTDQARDVRVRLCGENARHFDDMSGYRTTQIRRIIGEVANEPPESE